MLFGCHPWMVSPGAVPLSDANVSVCQSVCEHNITRWCDIRQHWRIVCENFIKPGDMTFDLLIRKCYCELHLL